MKRDDDERMGKDFGTTGSSKRSPLYMYVHEPTRKTVIMQSVALTSRRAGMKRLSLNISKEALCDLLSEKRSG